MQSTSATDGATAGGWDRAALTAPATLASIPLMIVSPDFVLLVLALSAVSLITVPAAVWMSGWRWRWLAVVPAVLAPPLSGTAWCLARFDVTGALRAGYDDVRWHMGR